MNFSSGSIAIPSGDWAANNKDENKLKQVINDYWSPCIAV